MRVIWSRSNDLALIVTATIALAACGSTGPSGSQRIRPELIRVAGQAGLVSPNGGRLAGSPGAPYWSSDLSISSFRVPIREIVLQDSASSRWETIYHCAAASNDGCLVELAGNALEDLLAARAVTVPAGDYVGLNIQTCSDEGVYTGYLTGTVSLAGQTWYTRTLAVLDTTGPAEPVAVVYSGCGRNYQLPRMLSVADTAGSVLTFRMYFDLRDIAWAALGTQETAGAWLPGGCAGDRPDATHTQPFLCTGYPDVAGLMDAQAPVEERYRINGGATFGLFFTASGDEPLTGYTRRFFTEGVGSNPGFNADTPIWHFADNGDGTYLLESYGGLPDWHVPYFSAPAFRRADHSGNFTTANGPGGTYSAVRLP
jgi:hypothetical protein